MEICQNSSHNQDYIKEGDLMKEADKIKKAFALACRALSNTLGCPAGDGDFVFPECNGETGECGDGEYWGCWQRYFTELTENEAVCRVCGCTQYNACDGGCYWVEPDLCSKCASNLNIGG